ncbi:hypothetical protein V5O48_010578 [Marasmius crinis-equi]|uniref:Fruit-body specific protein a n=1 Tax=Marasmius crinis-equi TaxID=585013 RepID=A0ABR3F8L0_9AGAR
MFSAARLLAIALLSVAYAEALVYPAYQGIPDSEGDSESLDSTSRFTDVDTISSTITSVDQKGGATTDTPPDQTAPETSVVAIDGQALDSTAKEPNAIRRSFVDRTTVRRTDNRYVQVFNGTGVDATDRDAAIVGTAFLSYTVLPDNTYNAGPCMAFCDSIAGCTFFNLYYEVDDQKSSLKCAAFGDVHTAEEKTYQGQQGSYIQNSSGWVLASDAEEGTYVEGYEQVFGPLTVANNAPHYMGFVLLDRYDPAMCGQECNKRGIDRLGGACKYFNIWRAVVDHKPKSYTCAMYYIPTDRSTATNHGQGNLSVTLSRGYRRISLIDDGNFDNYQCPDGGAFCFTNATSSWIGTSPLGGNYDASIFHSIFYAYHGTGVALLGSAFGSDSLPGTLSYAHALKTQHGRDYTVQFFLQSTYSGRILERDAFVSVVWNGQTVKTFQTGYASWAYYEVTVRATGNDRLSFVGGKAPAYTFIDEVYVFLK